MATTAPNDLTWLLDDFVTKTAGAVSALVTSRDGMEVASLNHDEDGAVAKLSAITSGLHALARGTDGVLKDAGGVRQIIVELDGGHLFVVAAGDGALLSILVDADADVDQVSFEMNLLVKQVPNYLYVAPRPVAPGTTAL